MTNTKNRDLILREELAIARTKMAIDRTFLSYLRTALYFSVAGLTVNSLLDVKYGEYAEVLFWIIAFIILGIGIIQTRKQMKKLKDSEKHIGYYLLNGDK